MLGLADTERRAVEGSHRKRELNRKRKEMGSWKGSKKEELKKRKKKVGGGEQERRKKLEEGRGKEAGRKRELEEVGK